MQSLCRRKMSTERMSMVFLMKEISHPLLAEKKGVHYEDNQGMNYQQYKESQYDLLADTLRKYLDMEAVYGMLQEAEYDKSRIG